MNWRSEKNENCSCIAWHVSAHDRWHSRCCHRQYIRQTSESGHLIVIHWIVLSPSHSDFTKLFGCRQNGPVGGAMEQLFAWLRLDSTGDSVNMMK
jgi:hypothetical protein